jgi:hypothetical protein
MVNEVREGPRNIYKGGEWNDMWHNDNFDWLWLHTMVFIIIINKKNNKTK